MTLTILRAFGVTAHPINFNQLKLFKKVVDTNLRDANIFMLKIGKIDELNIGDEYAK
jgi:hypothetical protein